jgi:dCMP deaminase
VSVRDSVLYCTTQPCVICAKMLINAGIRRIVYEAGYDDELSLQMLGEAGVELVRMDRTEPAAEPEA